MKSRFLLFMRFLAPATLGFVAGSLWVRRTWIDIGISVSAIVVAGLCIAFLRPWLDDSADAARVRRAARLTERHRSSPTEGSN